MNGLYFCMCMHLTREQLFCKNCFSDLSHFMLQKESLSDSTCKFPVRIFEYWNGEHKKLVHKRIQWYGRHFKLGTYKNLKIKNVLFAISNKEHKKTLKKYSRHFICKIDRSFRKNLQVPKKC